MGKPWFLYVLRCADGSLYTGVTTDLERRLSEHNSSPRGARYTRARRPVSMVCSWPFADRSRASQAEAALKRLKRAHKLEVISGTRPAPWLMPR
jgi:putative endonuclease